MVRLAPNSTLAHNNNKHNPKLGASYAHKRQHRTQAKYLVKQKIKTMDTIVRMQMIEAARQQTTVDTAEEDGPYGRAVQHRARRFVPRMQRLDTDRADDGAREYRQQPGLRYVSLLKQ